ncbi:hypothetical protein FALBO_5820 [Fusarium albosuccineum]|uniref:Uncharacterized protein n=1 Tax=Fusarium albosuccineum TaxID=1237068 RepID=A0A8H4LEJ7_9HYPO|nr:hypothetical protein FALBO_5820 [Fusarium albosuccineum]
MDLPQLGRDEAPIRHPNCCLSLSFKLLQTLTRVFSDGVPASQTSTVLSIGSGSGILEALLLSHVESEPQYAASFNVEGVEVQQLNGKESVNKYLPEQAIYTVRGTWDVVSRLQDPDIAALMFIYPRQPRLVSEYIWTVAEQDLDVKVVVWLGPVSDWEVFEPCFQIGKEGSAGVFTIVQKSQGAEAGLDEYELMVVFGRTS